MTKHSMSRFFRTVETLVDGLQSGEIVVPPVEFSGEALSLAAETMQTGLRNLTRILAGTERRDSAFCSLAWDRLLTDAQTAINCRWECGEVCLSYWLLQPDQPEFMVGHYAASEGDRDHLGGLFFYRLPLEESPCGRTLMTNVPLFFPDARSLFETTLLSSAADHVGSLATWPICWGDSHQPVAVLLLESRTAGVIDDRPETHSFLSCLSELFALPSQLAFHDRTDLSQSPMIPSADSVLPPASIPNNMSNAK